MAKKSVALSGVPAGNTALCTVGLSGNDLHYRGYDILEIAERCEFEEVAHLLIHERWPSAAELAALSAAAGRGARAAAALKSDARAAAGDDTSDGRAAHRRVRAGLPCARRACTCG